MWWGSPMETCQLTRIGSWKQLNLKTDKKIYLFNKTYPFELFIGEVGDKTLCSCSKVNLFVVGSNLRNPMSFVGVMSSVFRDASWRAAMSWMAARPTLEVLGSSFSCFSPLDTYLELSKASFSWSSSFLLVGETLLFEASRDEGEDLKGTSEVVESDWESV